MGRIGLLHELISSLQGLVYLNDLVEPSDMHRPSVSARRTIAKVLHSRRMWLGALVCFLLFATGSAGFLVLRRALNREWMILPAYTVAEESSPDDELTLHLVFPTKVRAARVFEGNFWASPQLIELSGKAPFLLATPSGGAIAALKLDTGEVMWRVSLPANPEYETRLQAAPVQVGDRLVVAYIWIHKTTGKYSHHARVLNLRTGKLDLGFRDLEFSAEVPAAEGAGIIRFDPTTQHSRSALAHVPSSAGLGHVYVAFGSIHDEDVWHGWLFELDLDAWMRGPPDKPISSVFVTTPEVDCDDGRAGKLCGGGIWAYAGPRIYHGKDDFDIVIQTGNGLLNLKRRDYAQSMLRLRPGLKFDPVCDEERCSNVDPSDPPDTCLSTCKNLFVPRLLPTDPPLRPTDGSCDGMAFLPCLEKKDWDFGSSSPIRVELPNNRAVYVTAGKAGDLYLVDGETLGIMYDRKQIVDLCGTIEDPCADPNEGLIINEPQIGRLNGSPVVVIATHSPDESHAAGVIAYKIKTEANQPRLEKLWRVPDPATVEARRWFRAPPTRPVIADFEGEPVVWVADNGRDGRLLGIRLLDGKILANVRTAGWPMRNAKPVLHQNVIYVPTAVPNHENLTWIEAYEIRR